jgi:DNA-binding NarL/FixJ family response regulator
MGVTALIWCLRWHPHVSRVLTKLNAANRVQVAIMMHDARLT